MVHILLPIIAERVLSESRSIQAGSRKKPTLDPNTWSMPGYLNQGDENVYLILPNPWPKSFSQVFQALAKLKKKKN